jgi:hypothetical protein
VLGRVLSSSFLFQHLRNFRLKYPYRNATKPIRVDIKKKLGFKFLEENSDSNLKPVFAHIKNPQIESGKPPNTRVRLKM